MVESKLYGDVECAQQPRPHSPTGDLGEIAGVNGQNSEGMCQGGKSGTGKLYTDVCLCCSAHTCGVRSVFFQNIHPEALMMILSIYTPFILLCLV